LFFKVDRRFRADELRHDKYQKRSLTMNDESLQCVIDAVRREQTTSVVVTPHRAHSTQAQRLLLLDSVTKFGTSIVSLHLNQWCDATEDDDEADALVDALARCIRKRGAQFHTVKLTGHVLRRRLSLSRVNRLATAFRDASSGCDLPLHTLVLDDLLLAPNALECLLGVAMQCAPQLQVLSISGNEANRSATPALIHAIAVLPLVTLTAQRCNFDARMADEGFVGLCRAIAQCATLRNVAFANLFDGARHIRATTLRVLLEQATQLHSLSLSNLHLDHFYFAEIAHGLQRCQLEQFALIDRPIDRVTNRQVWQPLVDVVHRCTSLRSLEFTMAMPRESIAAFTEALESNRRLTRLVVLDEQHRASPRIEWLAKRNCLLQPCELSRAVVQFALAIAPLDLPALVQMELFDRLDPIYVHGDTALKYAIFASVKQHWHRRLRSEAAAQTRINML
jgi:hypothetical protein